MSFSDNFRNFINNINVDRIKSKKSKDQYKLFYGKITKLLMTKGEYLGNVSKLRKELNISNNLSDEYILEKYNDKIKRNMRKKLSDTCKPLVEGESRSEQYGIKLDLVESICNGMNVTPNDILLPRNKMHKIESLWPNPEEIYKELNKCDTDYALLIQIDAITGVSLYATKKKNNFNIANKNKEISSIDEIISFYVTYIDSYFDSEGLMEMVVPAINYNNAISLFNHALNEKREITFEEIDLLTKNRIDLCPSHYFLINENDKDVYEEEFEENNDINYLNKQIREVSKQNFKIREMKI